MSIIKHSVHEDFLQIEDGLDSPQLRESLGKVKAVLATNPYPPGSERRKGDRFRIWIRKNGEELELLYDVERHDIYLISIRRRWHKRFLDAWNDLMTFAP